jgi:hypothetical protein
MENERLHGLNRFSTDEIRPFHSLRMADQASMSAMAMFQQLAKGGRRFHFWVGTLGFPHPERGKSSFKSVAAIILFYLILAGTQENKCQCLHVACLHENSLIDRAFLGEICTSEQDPTQFAFSTALHKFEPVLLIRLDQPSHASVG